MGLQNIQEIPSGLRGTTATIAAMRKQAITGALNLDVRNLAESIIRGVPNKDYQAEADAIFQWVKKNVRYTRDPLYAERVATPYHTLLVSGQGDCDDSSTAIAALAVSVGLPVEFVTVAADPKRPNSFSHIYARIKVEDAWMGADATVPQSYLGWEPPVERVFAKKRWTILGQEVPTVRGFDGPVVPSRVGYL